jgi:hypothetical protein
MIEIELPCCGDAAVLGPEATTVRCEGCAIEHLLADDVIATRPVVGAAPALAGAA